MTEMDWVDALLYKNLYSQFLAYRLETCKDDKTRIKYALLELAKYYSNNPAEKRIFNDKRNKKNKEKSNEFRETGNKLYQKSADNYIEAWKCYSQSIAFAPEDSEELALAYANRSAVLFRLKRYAACANDAKLALDLNKYPKEKRPKVHLRRVESLALLKSEDLRQAFTDGFSWVQSTNLKDKEKIAKELKDAILKHKHEPIENIRGNEPGTTFDVVLKKFEKNPDANNLLRVQINQSGEARLVAKRDVKPGTLLMVIKSYVTALDIWGIHTHCSGCMKEIWSSIPCTKCALSVYCSEKCRESAWIEYHHIECRVLKLLGVECGSTRVLLKLIIKAKKEAGGLKELLDLIKSVDRPDSDYRNCLDDKGNIRNTFESLYFGAKMSTKNRHTYKVVMASKIAYVLAAETNFFGGKMEPKKILRDQAVLRIATVLLELGMSNTMIGSMKKLMSTDSATVYAWEINTWSLLSQHSCSCNSVTMTMKGAPTIFSSSIIKKGETITVNFWHTSFMNACKHNRQDELTSKGIVCKCTACVERWPVYNDLESVLHFPMKSPADLEKMQRLFDQVYRHVHMVEDAGYKDKNEALDFFAELAYFCQEHSRVPTKELLDAEANIFHIVFLAADRTDISM